MTASWRQQVVNFCFPNGPLKIWCKPFCIFFCTFTIVMFILVMSIDLRRRRYLPLDAVIWDFEGTPQDSSTLIDIIRKSYIDPPKEIISKNISIPAPSKQLLKIFRRKREGTAIECGATVSYTNTDWLVDIFDWRNLKIQPNPVEIENLRSGGHGAYTSHSCVSPEPYPKHTHIRTSTNFPNGTLTAVPCFPLFSMMKSFNATALDLLILNDVKAPLTILQTLPIDNVKIEVISFVVRQPKNNKTEPNGVCCDDKTKDLMRKWGYTKTSSCPSKVKTCYYTCTKIFCPSLNVVTD